jgi:hypothetical protein
MLVGGMIEIMCHFFGESACTIQLSLAGPALLIGMASEK